MKVLIVNGFPGMTTNYDLKMGLKKAGFKTDIFSALQLKTQSKLPQDLDQLSFKYLLDTLKTEIKGILEQCDLTVVTYCFGSWMLSQIYEEIAQHHKERLHCVHIAPLYFLDEFRRHYEKKGLPLEETLFTEAATVLPGKVENWNNEWNEISKLPIDTNSLREAISIQAQNDPHLDQASKKFASQHCRREIHIASEDHEFSNSRIELIHEVVKSILDMRGPIIQTKNASNMEGETL